MRQPHSHKKNMCKATQQEREVKIAVFKAEIHPYRELGERQKIIMHGQQ
jgi:hypothetical protein